MSKLHRRLRLQQAVALLCLLAIIVIIGYEYASLKLDVDLDEPPPGAVFEKARRESLVEHKSFYVNEKNLQHIPRDWIRDDLCPACFGTDLCGPIERGELRVEIESNEATRATAKGGVYRGWYSLCLTRELVDEFRRLYSSSSNSDGRIQQSRDERSILFTSLVVHPEIVIIKFLKQSQVLNQLASREYGACGRLVVIEHGGKPLYSAIDSDFEDRAYMALQLIALVRSLWHADRKWFALYTHIRFDSLAVSHHGQVYLTDLKHLSIVQNHVQQSDSDENIAENEHDQGHFIDDEIAKCDDECFNRLLVNISASASLQSETDQTFALTKQCQMLHEVSGPFMYSALCRNILADTLHEGNRRLGLLHDVPDDDAMKDRRQRITEALSDCANDQASFKTRVQAIELIYAILSTYTGFRL